MTGDRLKFGLLLIVVILLLTADVEGKKKKKKGKKGHSHSRESNSRGSQEVSNYRRNPYGAYRYNEQYYRYGGQPQYVIRGGPDRRPIYRTHGDLSSVGRGAREDGSHKDHSHKSRHGSAKSSKKSSKKSKKSHEKKGRPKHKHHSKESQWRELWHHKKPWNSGSSQSDSEESGSKEYITPIWCWEWCWKYTWHNFRQLFSNMDPRYVRAYKDRIIYQYCSENYQKFEPYCRGERNSTEEPSTTERITSTTTTTIPSIRQCRTFQDCYADECCVNRGYWSECVGRPGLNEDCTNVQSYRHRDVRACPCQPGLECKSKTSVMMERYPNLSRYVLRYYNRERYGMCRPSSTPTTTEERTTAPTLPETTTKVTRTTTEKLTTMKTSTTTPESITTTQDISTTASQLRNCSNHFDCEFLECCMRDQDQLGGYCSPFASRGEFCSTLNTFAASEMLDSCPCGSFLRCKTYQREDDPLETYTECA